MLFFLRQTGAHKIESHWDGLGYGFVPSSVAGNPEFGTVRVSIPIYKSKTFFEEGFKVLEQHPELWIEHLSKFRFLFFDNLFPGVPGVVGFIPMMDIYRYVVFYMLILAIGGVVVSVRERTVSFAHTAVFTGIFLLCASSLYLFTVTHQYFTNFSYTVYVLFVFGMMGVIRHYRQYKRWVWGYLGALLLIVIYHYSAAYIKRLWVEPIIKVEVQQLQKPIFDIHQEKDIASSEQFYVDTLNFVPKERLTHKTLGPFDYTLNFFMTTETTMTIKESGVYMFQIYADDGYEVFIDGERVMGFNGLKKMDEFQVRKDIRLEKGEYHLKIDLFQQGVLSGLVGYYRRIDNIVPYAPYEFDTKKGKGHYIGENSEYVEFSPVP